MSDMHEFEHDGVIVKYRRATVRSQMEMARMHDKLLGAYGHIGDNIAPDSVVNNFAEYSGAMARCEKIDAPWYGHSDMSDSDLKAAFEAFLDEDPMLHTRLRIAAFATSTPKKTTSDTSETSESSKTS